MSWSSSELCRAVSAVVPPLTAAAHKGQAGRVGVVGGSLEYTGAPYFAGISALRVGADLVHVFCQREAGVPLKSFSPELMVHPVLDGTDPLGEIEEQLGRLHVIVAGPGLGRRPTIFSTLSHVLQAARDRHLLLILDADALFYLNDNFDTLQGYPNTLLTPNRVELARLYRSVMQTELKAEQVKAEHVQKLAKRLGVTVACKGAVDVIASGDIVVTCDLPGSPRRCGGQGDLLSGAAATFFYWAFGTAAASKEPPALPPSVLAAWAACALTRTAAVSAFGVHGRSTLTTDILKYLPKAFTTLFPDAK
ncbi:hypothetical protein Pmani_014771 [Petrolisthes manimaculis]|uniref:ATP-dependent (S)-NAD(P)H-hydrate dehydratase n=1 Tax=Petrolisthes manimaculis TaxID=1843537 RepID=A0AAE1UCR1_9EUCA|nr:hypothetical protein Pmani_014771 [Petrolisthes manimaculis]